MAELLALPKPVESLQNGAGLSVKIEQAGPAQKKKVALAPQIEQLARTLELTVAFQ